MSPIPDPRPLYSDPEQNADCDPRSKLRRKGKALSSSSESHSSLRSDSSTRFPWAPPQCRLPPPRGSGGSTFSGAWPLLHPSYFCLPNSAARAVGAFCFCCNHESAYLSLNPEQGPQNTSRQRDAATVAAPTCHNARFRKKHRIVAAPPASQSCGSP